jgi:dihydrofolate reductase / thymidylate synthase
MFNIILASDINNGIGLNNSIPWDNKDDKIFFKKMTSFNEFNGINILIMGRKTFDSLNLNYFNDRILYVITRNIKENTDNIFYFNSFQNAYNNAIKYINSKIWVIGGKEIYELALKHYKINKIYYNIIKNEYKCDTYINMNKYNIIWENIKETENIIYKIGYLKKNVEIQYLNLLHDVLNNGNIKDSRNGKVISSFGKSLSWDLNDGFPLLTSKKMFWRGIVEELLFFIRGSTDTNELSKKGIKIWEGNTSNEFLKNMNLDYPKGFMGPMYGYQWRFFNKDYKNENDKNYVDQLQNIINEINNNPNSRRLIMTDFNPLQVNQGVLYPCHSLIIQFYIMDNKLSCSMYQRSGDLFLGVPFNIASTSLLLCIISKLTNKEPGIVNLHIGDNHIYEEHIEQVKEQLNNLYYDSPQIEIPNFKTLKQVEESKYEDYKLINYNSCKAIVGKLIV